VGREKNRLSIEYGALGLIQVHFWAWHPNPQKEKGLPRWTKGTYVFTKIRSEKSFAFLFVIFKKGYGKEYILAEEGSSYPRSLPSGSGKVRDPG